MKIKKKFFKILVFLVLPLLIIFNSVNKVNAQYSCGGGICPAGTEKAGTEYTTTCELACDVTPNTCWSDISCTSETDCVANPGYCDTLTPSCGASCSTGVMVCDPTTKGCYSDCSSCTTPTPVPPTCAPSSCTYTEADATCPNSAYGNVRLVNGYGNPCTYDAACSTTECCTDTATAYNACGYDLTTICGTSSTNTNTYYVEPNSCGAQCTDLGNNCGQCGNPACPTNTPTPSPTPACSALMGTSCSSAANICGVTNTGSYNCSGTCVDGSGNPVSAPADPGTCTKTSSPNACGGTNTTSGYACPSGCTASTPSAPANPAQCQATSGSNVCGQTNTNYGYACPSGCTATTPSVPNDPPACIRTSATNACGDTNSASGYECSGTGTCSVSAPPTPLCIKGNVCDDKSVPTNGIKDVGDLNRVGDTLDLNNNAKITITDTSGNYAFHSLSGGTYTVRLTVASGFSSASQNPITFTNMTTDQTANFCIAKYYNCKGTMYNDVNNNGVYDTGTDTIFTSSQVDVSVPGHSAKSSTTDGTYTITNLVNSSYTASVTTPTGYRTYTAAGNAPNCAVNNADATNVNFLIQGYTIQGNVFEDKNVPPNGAKDPSDANYPGATVTLTLPEGSTRTATTDASGNYYFYDLKTGTYSVALTDPPGYTSQYSGALSNPRAIAITGEAASVTANFGIAKYYTISGNIYKDMDAGGRLNLAPGPDTAYSGRTVELYPATGVMDSSTLIESLTTDASGGYVFGNAAPKKVINGIYRVKAVMPTGLKQVIDVTDPANPVLNTYIHTVTVSNANVAGINFLMQGYKLSTHVYEDKTTPFANFAQEAGDPDYSDASIDFLNSDETLIKNLASDASGNALFVNDGTNLIFAATYQVRINAVAGYRLPTPSTVSRTVGPDQTIIFAILKYYTFTGALYNDVDNGNGINASDTPFIDGSQTISIVQDRPSPDPTQTGNSSIVNGTYTITNVVNGNYTTTLPVPSGYRDVIPPPPTPPATSPPVGQAGSQIISVANGNVSTVDFLIQGWTINLHVYKDWGQNGVEDSQAGYLSDPDYSGATISLSGGYSTRPNTTTNASGNALFTDLKGCLNPASCLDPLEKYTLTISVPPNYTNTTFAAVAKFVGPDTLVIFGITPTYTITSSGVYVDSNKNLVKEALESYYNNSISGTITSTNGIISNPTITYPGNGQYSITGLTTGSYAITLTSLPSGYLATYPSPTSYNITVGGTSTGCTYSPNQTPDSRYIPTPGTPNAACTGGPNPEDKQFQNLHFGITNSYAWFQCQNGDCRKDAGYITTIPNTAPASSKYASIVQTPLSNTPGLVFSGNSSYDFGAGSASSFGWKVGGSSGQYPETFSPSTVNVIRTSYLSYNGSLTQTGLTPKDLISPTDYCNGGGLSNCKLSSTLPNGIYKVSGNLTINTGYAFPANSNFVFLVSGDLRIRWDGVSVSRSLLVPNSSTATFSVGGNITIDNNIGQLSSSTACVPSSVFGINSTGCDIEGFFSADKSFTIESLGSQGSNCWTNNKDRRLNIAGAVVVNASLTGSGQFVNNRDMCDDNLLYPAYTFTERPDFYLNAPDFIKKPSNLWQEIAP